MNPYEERQEARRQRLETAAERAREEAAHRFQRADAAVEGIPFGQPILVGHHSESRHRAALKRCDTNMRAGIEAQERAADLAHRAAGVGSAGISADDPEAVRKLQEKLAEMEAEQALMKAVNAAHARFLKKPESLETADLPEAVKAKIRIYFPAYSLEPHPFAPYQLTNLSANLRRVRERIESLRREHHRRAVQAEVADVRGRIVTEHPGFRVIEDLEENRLLIEFETRQPAEVAAALKGYGFRWAPTRRAWSRQLSANARAALTHWVLPKLTRLLSAEDPPPEEPAPAPSTEHPRAGDWWDRGLFE